MLGYCCCATDLSNKHYESSGDGSDAGLLDLNVQSAYGDAPEAAWSAAACAGAPGEFVLQLAKGRNAIAMGFRLDCCDGKTLHVAGLGPGLAASYNRDARLGDEVGVGDYIVGVNGTSGNAVKMLRLLEQEEELELTIRRPVEFQVRVTKAWAGPLGLKLAWSDNSISLIVTEVTRGIVQRWNAANPGRHVRLGDRVLKVNGLRRAPAEMLAMLVESVECELVMSRPCEYSDIAI